MLPFRPDEEAGLETVINQACAFRDFLQSFTNSPRTTTEEVPTLLFYLRKIEGGEVLLAYETNFFRQELHKRAPVASEPPPILEHSLSTRKPRPSKHQKIMAQLGVEREEELPPHLRPRQFHHYKRKSTESRPTASDHSDSTGSIPTLSSIPAQNNTYPAAVYARRTVESMQAFSPEPSATFFPRAPTRSPSFTPISPSAQVHGLGSSNPFESGSPFADMANGEPGPAVDPALEVMENTHANEALEALNASKVDTRSETGV